MKKIFLIFLLLIPLFFIMISSSEVSLLDKVEKEGYSKIEKDIYWEYVKDKLFEGKVYRNLKAAKKLSGPILFVLRNATEKDSLAVLAILEELKKVIPNRTVDFFSNFTKHQFSEFTKIENNRKVKTKGHSYFDLVSSTLKLNFEIDENQIKRGANHQKQTLYFSFSKHTSLEDSKKYIQFEALRSICFINSKKDDSLLLNIKYPPEAIFNDPTYTILNKSFTEIDKFLISKLYSDDFEEQFSAYMYRTYPWRYANLFVNKKTAKIQVYVLLTIFGLLVILFSFYLFNSKKTRYQIYFFSVFTLFIGLINLQWLYSYFIEIQNATGTIEQNIFSFLYLLGASFIVSLLLWFIEQKFINNYFGFAYQFFIKLVLTFVLLFAPFLTYVFLIKRGMYPDYNVLFFMFLGLTLARGLLMYLNYFSESVIRQKELELSKLKELNAKNELKSLHAHINPHFLYNALNTITVLMYESTSKAEEMMIALSDLFRYSINRKGKKMSTVKDEVLMVENYLKIEKIRFEERLQFTIDVDDELREKEIPMYILQPLIENAVKHGISKIEEKGEITLSIKEKQNSLVITITDNGAGFPENLYSGYGLQSVNDLLRLSYGNKASLNWTNNPNKKIEILMPLEFHL